MLQQPQLLHLQPTCGLDWITGIAKGALNHPSGLVNKHIPRIGNGAVNISAKFCSYVRHMEFATNLKRFTNGPLSKYPLFKQRPVPHPFRGCWQCRCLSHGIIEQILIHSCYWPVVDMKKAGCFYQCASSYCYFNKNCTLPQETDCRLLTLGCASPLRNET